MRMNFSTLQELLRFVEEEGLVLYPTGKTLAVVGGETHGEHHSWTFVHVSAVPMHPDRPQVGMFLDYCCPTGSYIRSSEGDRKQHFMETARPKLLEIKAYCRDRGYAVYEARFTESGELSFNSQFKPDEGEADRLADD